jgi:Protein of unknown function (DUF3485)
MKNQKWIILSVALVLMAGTAGALTWFRAHQKLGSPGIKAVAIPGSVQMKINLPERVLDFTSTNAPEPQTVLNYLPPDTTYVERIYTAPDGFQVQTAIILMGADRTSIHNAEYCLTGSGFSGKEKSVANIPVAGPQPYQLSVARWNLSGDFAQPDGRKVERHGVYIFWFVADGEETPDHLQIMKRMALHLLGTGVLQRWAYVLYFAQCEAGQEDATFERMKNLIASSVPEYEWPPTGH